MERTRAHLVFSGRVQGVFFRANTQRKALELSLSGWVRNVPDGTVEAVVEGPSEGIDELVGFLRTEVPAARVEEVKRSEGTYSGEFTSFEIRR